MRRADLRMYDIFLIAGILGVFCALSVVFFFFLWMGYFLPQQVPVKTYLWLSYGIIFVLAAIVYTFAKKPQYEWIRTESSGMIGKGKYSLEKGTSYLIGEDKATDVAMDVLTTKVPCLYITRTNPDILRQKNKQMDEATVIWLTELGATNTINPTEVEEISYLMQQYMEKNKPSVILFDGLAYLLQALPFSRVLHLIQDVRDRIALEQGVLLFSLAKDVVEQNKWEILKKELVMLQ